MVWTDKCFTGKIKNCIMRFVYSVYATASKHPTFLQLMAAASFLLKTWLMIYLTIHISTLQTKVKRKDLTCKHLKPRNLVKTKKLLFLGQDRCVQSQDGIAI